jgi:5-methylcytosine-specific restriction endonuclease McrA
MGCCEYCFTPEIASFAAHEVDPIVAQKHGGLTQEDNLALSCTLCNKHKGTDLASIDPNTGEITPLYHPRRDRWFEHFCLVGQNLFH